MTWPPLWLLSWAFWLWLVPAHVVGAAIWFGMWIARTMPPDVDPERPMPSKPNPVAPSERGAWPKPVPPPRPNHNPATRWPYGRERR